MHDTITKPLLKWYGENKRVLPWREKKDPYEIWVSEIMLQQTRVEAVKPFYERFMRELPNVAALAVCPEEMAQHSGHKTGAYILESERRSVKKFESVDIVLDFHYGCRELQGVVDDMAQFGFGNILTEETLCHLERQLLKTHPADAFEKRFRHSLYPLGHIKSVVGSQASDNCFL